jgi:hypothetical protein
VATDPLTSLDLMILSSVELWSLSSIILLVTHWNSSSPKSGSGFDYGMGCIYPPSLTPSSCCPLANYSATKSFLPVFILFINTTQIPCFTAEACNPISAVVIIFFLSLYPTSVALKCSANVSSTMSFRLGSLRMIESII